MITPQKLEEALEKCAEEMSKACGHNVYAFHERIQQELENTGRSFKTVTTIKVSFVYEEYSK